MKNLSLVHMAVAGFSPLEILGWENLSKVSDSIVMGSVISDSSELKSWFESLFPEEHGQWVLIVDGRKEDFFSEAHLQHNRTIFRCVPTLVMAEPKPDFIYRVHRFDISGMLTTDSPVEEIKSCVIRLANKEKYFSARIVDALVAYTYDHNVAGGAAPDSVPPGLSSQPLSIRELEILRLVVRGKSAKEIAEDLFLSVHTIYTHRKNILRKLSCKNAAELVSYAMDKGLLRELA
ncbi:MAG: response regulator transcription factor [Flavobacteriales bacterium]|nr:response regulator transcription factor [Flavobacteriales bacterium]